MTTRRLRTGGAAALTAAVLCLGSAAASAQNLVQECPGLPNVRVEWAQTPFFDGSAYSVRSVRAASGSTSTTGWQLHHRPTANWPFNHLEPDTFINGSSLIGYSVWQGLMPVVPVPYFGTYQVTSLTSPDGECVFSPLTGGARTYDGASGAKLAIVGDSLVVLNELCGLGAPPAPPNYCAQSLSARLRDAGHRTWWHGGPGQGFLSWLDVTRERATTRPGKFVLALGTNDAIRQANATGSRREDERWNTIGATFASVNAIRAANPAACIVLVTVSGKPGNLFAYPEEARQVNTLLKNVAASANIGNVQIADFAQAAEDACPGWLSTPGRTCDLFSPDQVHLTGKGNDVRNPLIVQAASRCGS